MLFHFCGNVNLAAYLDGSLNRFVHGVLRCCLLIPDLLINVHYLPTLRNNRTCNWSMADEQLSQLNFLTPRSWSSWLLPPPSTPASPWSKAKHRVHNPHSVSHGLQSHEDETKADRHTSAGEMKRQQRNSVARWMPKDKGFHSCLVLVRFTDIAGRS